MKSLKFLLPLAVFAVLVGFLAAGLQRDPREVPSPLIGKPAPAFRLARLDDPARSIGRDDLRGRVWLLNVWASWCGACRDEHPVLLALAQRKLLPMVGLNYKDTRPEASSWLRRWGDPYEASLFDADGRLGLDFGVYGVPETFIIDREGVVRFKHIGPLTPEVVEQRIVPLLKELDA